jgi:hypothetical protein
VRLITVGDRAADRGFLDEARFFNLDEYGACGVVRSGSDRL